MQLLGPTRAHIIPSLRKRAPSPHSYQAQTIHSNLVCNVQPKCGSGQYSSSPVTVSAERECSECPPNTYQESLSHIETNTGCTAQPKCKPGERLMATRCAANTHHLVPHYMRQHVRTLA